MELILILFTVFILGFLLGRFVERVFFRMILGEVLKDLGIKPADLRKLREKLEREITEDSDESAEPELIQIRIEQHQGQLYAYRKDTEQFVGQSSTAEGLQREIRSRFKDTVKFIVDKAEGGDLLLQKYNT